jgi:cytochrome c biogenesis protein CcmG, thiol:disulfide interchange protein DsbE
MKMPFISIAGLAVTLSILLPPAAPGASPVAPGQPAPPVDLVTADGQPVSLAALRGKVVLVDFWASWCGPCAAAFPALEDLFQEYRTRGFEVMAVNLDEKRADAARFLSARPHAMTVVFDPGGKSARAFGLEGMPTSYLVGRDGTVRYVHTGYSQGAMENYRREIEQLLGDPRS